MANDFTHSEEYKYYPLLPPVDLLDALLDPEDITYPWDPADPQTEEYFVSQEGCLLQEWSEDEVTTKSQAFFTQLEQVWCSITSTVEP